MNYEGLHKEVWGSRLLTQMIPKQREVVRCHAHVQSLNKITYHLRTDTGVRENAESSEPKQQSKSSTEIKRILL